MTDSQDIGAALRRLALRELTAAGNGLARTGTARHAGIHAARRALRHVRALLALGAEEFGRAGAVVDARLQRLNRSLSPLRDAHVAWATLAQVPDVPQRRRVSAALRARRDALARDVSDEMLQRRRAALERTRAVLEGLDWAQLDAKTLRAGLKDARKRLAKAQRRAGERYDLARRHRWRRRLRKLHQQRQLLARAKIAVDVKAPRRAHRLQRLLGAERDLQLLRTLLQRLAAEGSIDAVSWRAPLRARTSALRQQIAAAAQ